MAPRFLENFCTPGYLGCDPKVWLISTSGLQDYVAFISRSFLSCRLAQQVHLNIWYLSTKSLSVLYSPKLSRMFLMTASLTGLSRIVSL